MNWTTNEKKVSLKVKYLTNFNSFKLPLNIRHKKKFGIKNIYSFFYSKSWKLINTDKHIFVGKSKPDPLEDFLGQFITEIN